jgi:hypothetical protein
MSVHPTPASVPAADLDPLAEECSCWPFWFYLALRDAGLIVFPAKYGVTSLLRYDRARTALTGRKFHRRACLSPNGASGP